MRNSTPLLVFGGIVLVLLVFAGLASSTANSSPSLQAARAFLAAVSTNNTETLQAVTDRESVLFAYAGSKVSGVRFVETNPFEGAFSKLRASVWTYGDLVTLEIAKDAHTVVSNELGIATVMTTNGCKMYLKRIDHAWKVFYIAKPKAKQ